jgi:hypothetical protein
MFAGMKTAKREEGLPLFFNDPTTSNPSGQQTQSGNLLDFGDSQPQTSGQGRIELI